MATAQFYIGQLIDHRLFGYRGVIIGVDATFQLTQEWYEQVARSRPPKDEPWYHVLVHEASHVTYVAQRNLSPAADTSQVNHPLLGQYFDRYDGARYFPRTTVN